MKIKKNIAISDSGFVFNPGTGDSFTVNDCGLEILQMMKRDQSEEEVKKFLLTNYMIDRDTVEKDIYDFKKILQRYKLID